MKDEHKEDEIEITPKMIIVGLIIIVVFLAFIVKKTGSELKEKTAEVKTIKAEIKSNEINIDAIIQIESNGDQFAISHILPNDQET